MDVPDGLAHFHGDLIEAALAHIDSPDREWQLLASGRRVQQYGREYNYDARGCHGEGSAPEVPRILRRLLRAAQKQSGVPVDKSEAGQVIVNEYLPGQGIALHRDAACFGPVIWSITLVGRGDLEFVDAREKVAIPTLAGTVIRMQGDARDHWKHQMPARKSDVAGGKRVPRERRVSVTYRSVR